MKFIKMLIIIFTLIIIGMFLINICKVKEIKELADSRIELIVNNQQVNLEDSILLDEAEVYIPLGETISGLNEQFTIYKKILSYKIYGNGNEYIFKPNSNIIKSNADKIKLESNIKCIDGKLYVPLDFIGKVLKCNVNFNKEKEKIYVDDFGKNFDYSWINKTKYVAHALGGIDKNSYTNSLEAFEYNYKQGHRVFEVDLSLTSDNELVAIHDWSTNTTENVLKMNLTAEQQGESLSLKEFKQKKIKGKYTTLSFEDIAKLMEQYPDMYIVTDTKETMEDKIIIQFEVMVKTAEKVNPSILDRIIPQVYNNNMFNCIMKIYDFKSVIYTLYNQGNAFSYENTLKFAYENGIKVITTYPNRADDYFLRELQDRGITIYMHTYNDEEQIKPWKEKGVHGFYTDFLVP